MLAQCDDPLEVHKLCSMLPVFTFEVRTVVPVEDAIRGELEVMAWRDNLNSTERTLVRGQVRKEQAMRMLLKVEMDVQAANRAIVDGSIASIVQGFVGAAKPEGVWFTAMNGKRCMVAVFDLADPAQIPSLAEPFFTGLGASIELSPAMDLNDLQAGLSRI